MATPGAQGNIEVKGDLVFGNVFQFQQDSGGAPADVYVGGSLIGNLGGGGTGIITASGGAEGSGGAHFYVNGSMYVNEIYVNGAGSGTPGTPSGNGGEITVYGNVTVQNILAASGGVGVGTDAGTGGSINIWGSVSSGDATWNINGGDATGGNAGNAGNLSVHSDASIQSLFMYGGVCTSNDETHRSGSGGNVEIDGNFACDSQINLRGGDRYGNLTTSGTETPPNAGQLYVYGAASFEDMFLEGGDVFTTGFAPHSAGNGGYIEIDGHLNVIDDCQFFGGYSDTGNGGNGGDIYVEGHAFIDDDLEFQGGQSNAGGNAGFGGTVDVNGDLMAGYVFGNGGFANAGNAGNGGFLYIEGSFTSNDLVEVSGGSCSSTDEVHAAGDGGEINCLNLNCENISIDIFGGDRYGATTVAGSPQIPGGGNMLVRGHLVCGNINGQGGSVTTNYPSSQGGTGASITVEGTASADYIYLYGGSSVGPNGGGRGGYFECRNFVNITDVDMNGGASNDSVVGGDAGTNGAAGTAYLYSGCSAYGLFFLDGSGAGSAPGDAVILRVAGSVTVGTIDMTDRPACVIDTWAGGGPPTVVKVNSLPNKTTFNTQAGTATADLSGFVADSILFTDSGGAWYYSQGTAI
jgi:hypothetical protein